MDNLIADGEVAAAIVVTKDNTYFNFEKGDSLKKSYRMHYALH